MVGHEAFQPQVFTRERVREFNESAFVLASNLREVVLRVLDQREIQIQQGVPNPVTPVVIWPSRGAVPIMVNGIRSLMEIDDDSNVLGDTARTAYIPPDILTYTLQGAIPEKRERILSADVKVLLYPFTMYTDQVNSSTIDPREAARRQRAAATNGLIEHVVHEPYPNNINQAWYQYMMGLVSGGGRPANLRPTLLAEYMQMAKVDNPRFILVDTVISGQATAHIAKAFAEAKHPITALFAVDGRRSRFDATFKQQLRQNIDPYYATEDESFVMFPGGILTEDLAPLLGIRAVAFKGLEDTPMDQIDNRLPKGWIPQNCVWLPEAGTNLELFRRFFKLAPLASDPIHDGDPNLDDQLGQLEAEVMLATQGRRGREMSPKNFLTISDPIKLTESGSGITLVEIPQNALYRLIREFATQWVNGDFDQVPRQQ